MDLLVSSFVSGIGLGSLYGLSAFAIVLVFKATGVANFAQGSLATLSTFLVLELIGDSFEFGLGIAVLIALVGSALLGVGVYFVVLLPNSAAGHLNLTIRTLGLTLLLVAMMQSIWGDGSPYRFPPLVQGPAFSVQSLTVSWLTVLSTSLALFLVAILLAAFFRLTRTGLSFRAVAEDAEIAQLLGLRTVRLGTITWAMATALSLCVGVLIAPTAYVSPAMMEHYLLFTFTAVILGGITSLPGALLGGLIVGTLSNVTASMFNPELSVAAIFGVLLASLLVRPQGILGHADVARL